MVIFTPNECDYIKSFYTTESEQSSDVVRKYANRTIKFVTSSLKFVTTENQELKDFLLNKLNIYGAKSIPIISFMKYVSGDKLARHTDLDKYGADKLYKTYVFQLSNSDDYTGGDLIVGNDIQSRELGSMVIITPTIGHEVTTVTSGERISMALFMLEDNLNLSKTII